MAKTKSTLWRVIKPQKMNLPGMREELYDVLSETADSIQNDFEDTVRTWEHEPEFHVNIKIPAFGQGGRASVEVYTEDDQYALVNAGSPDHIIPQKQDAKTLVFQGVYTEKTMPGVIDSFPGGESGSIQLRKSVHHPGFEAREFDRTITALNRDYFRSQMGKAMGRIARASKHAL